MKLQGKVVLITGASRGIGQRLAVLLAQEGADLAIAARTQSSGESRYPGTIHETAEQVRALGRRVLPIGVDLAVREQVVDMCKQTIDEFGRVDILINNAAHMDPTDGHYAPFTEYQLENLDHALAINFMGPFIACKEIVPHMIKQGSGMIFCTTSGSGKGMPAVRPIDPRKNATSIGYPVSKAAMDRMVYWLAGELMEHKIPVIAFNPGWTRVERMEVVYADLGRDYGQARPVDLVTGAYRDLILSPEVMSHTGKVVDIEDLLPAHKPG